MNENKIYKMKSNKMTNVSLPCIYMCMFYIVKLRQGSGKDRQGMALKVKGLKA